MPVQEHCRLSIRPLGLRSHLKTELARACARVTSDSPGWIFKMHPHPWDIQGGNACTFASATIRKNH